MKTIIAASVTLALAAIGGAAVGGDIKGGSTLLDDSRHAQLERWTGAGQFNLTRIYTLQPGDTARDFHAAVDGKGATFTLLQLTNPVGASYLVGGYNPQSWSSTDGWHVTERDADRTAFLFNMTEPAVYRQVPSSYILPSQGARQTFNQAGYGPAFGAGNDLFVNDRLDTAFSYQLTYGDPRDEGRSIIDRSVGIQLVDVNAMELFTLAPIPEPATAALLAAGVGVLALAAHRRRPCSPYAPTCP
jgi:hypothetical protein